MTRVSETHVPDEVYEEAKKHFTEKELADLTVAAAMINAWNRLAIAGRSTPGTYQPVRRELQKGRLDISNTPITHSPIHPLFSHSPTHPFTHSPTMVVITAIKG